MTRRYVLGHIMVGEPDENAVEECPQCGFDAFVPFPLTMLDERGVSQAGVGKACMRCYDEAPYPDEFVKAVVDNTLAVLVDLGEIE